MKTVLVIVCLIVITATAAAYAAPATPPALDSYIQAIASLPYSDSMIPKPPKGYGAVRDEYTGDFLILVPREYCGGNNAPGYKIDLGQTKYGSRINGYCMEF
jgi:hypothetical protein